MASLSEMIQLCRLCLVKDHVNIPIFDDPENVRQIPLKISSCLPVKISIDDNLPKKICDGCSNKLDLCYEFWNSTAHAEKTLLAMVEEKENQVPEAEMPQPFLLKVEAVESLEESQNQICEPPVPKPIPTLVKDEEEAEDPPAKRPRRSAAIQAQMQIIPESDDEDDAAEGLATTKEVAEMDDDFEDPDVPDMIVDIDEVKPGPSGLNQTGVNSQLSELNKLYGEKIKEEPDDNKIEITRYNIDAEEKFEGCLLGSQEFYETEHHPTMCHENDGNVVLVSTLAKMELNSCIEPNHELFREIECEEASTGENALSVRYSSSIHETHRETNHHQCKECGKYFTKSAYLKKHLKIHTGQKQYKCNDCGKSFVRENKLIIHSRSHTGEKPYKCRECGKCFAQAGQLTAHLRTHTGEKPFKCNECNKCFAQKDKLLRHARIHTGEKPYKCEECEKCFSDLDNMQRHVLVHKGDKPFKCHVCGKGFVRRTYLTYHLRSHTGERPFKCMKCDKCYRDASGRQRHFLHVHSLE